MRNTVLQTLFYFIVCDNSECIYENRFILIIHCHKFIILPIKARI